MTAPQLTSYAQLGPFEHEITMTVGRRTATCTGKTAAEAREACEEELGVAVSQPPPPEPASKAEPSRADRRTVARRTQSRGTLLA